MALFRRTKEEKKEAAPKKEEAVSSRGASHGAAGVLHNPRITEKATNHQVVGIYTFDVGENATKRSVVAAVSLIYKVTPRKVRMVRIPAKIKRSQRTGARGVSRGGKKAYVYLKKGDTITIT